ncbi:hypothetical protein Intca_2799 [Intrasporangium calvum DSM 43043]|uniref:Uncharacterized protein n=1 Tax=Intrasporangium calvum (strain ATCC 23552 / DSM 43043 / JCM 3097 / NBRC 12989 / NCIMB 10167 / NRRL B-3866 / 7 KIP) TaxID=710696 RepID=E6S9R2_INTC7|nr:hypothetical protein Intca_2799 [Intrasporangium calvum DSM 43043]
MIVILHLRAAVQQLYAVPPGDFTALRGRLANEARAAGDQDLAKQVAALRKPTVAAWALNHFVRTHLDELAEFRSFAELLREAQRTLDADQLRALGRERARRVDALGLQIAAAARDAGNPVGAAPLVEVHDTLVALIADEEAEKKVLTGALVKALSYSGFGSVDIEDAVAIDDDEPALTVVQGSGEGDGRSDANASSVADDLEERRRAKREAQRNRLAGALKAARDAAREADRNVAVLTARQEEVTEGIADLERRLATARDRLAKVTAELEDALGARDRRQAAQEQAEEALSDHDPRR